MKFAWSRLTPQQAQRFSILFPCLVNDFANCAVFCSHGLDCGGAVFYRVVRLARSHVKPPGSMESCEGRYRHQFQISCKRASMPTVDRSGTAVQPLWTTPKNRIRISCNRSIALGLLAVSPYNHVTRTVCTSFPGPRAGKSFMRPISVVKPHRSQYTRSNPSQSFTLVQLVCFKVAMD